MYELVIVSLRVRVLALQVEASVEVPKKLNHVARETAQVDDVLIQSWE